VESPSAPKLPPSEWGEQDDDITRTEDVRPRLDTNPGIGGAGHAGAVAPREPIAQREPLAREPVAPRESREEVQTLIRAAVAEGVASVLGETQRLMRHLERRIEELERRPVTVAAAAPAPAPLVPMVGAGTAVLTHQAQVPQYASPAAAVVVSVSPRPPLLDIATIERSVHVDLDSGLDGRHRKRRNVLLVTFFFLAVFGVLFALLAQSYSPHN
jgi:hypothetical protein